MHFRPWKRREVLAVLGGAAAWPLAALAQQAQPMRRVGWLFSLAEDDPEGTVRLTAFRQTMAELGWSEGGNLRIDYRWGGAAADVRRKQAAELIALAPDVIVSVGSAAAVPLLQGTRTIPIVFVNVVDPVGSGYVASLARPGGNATGFTSFEYRIAGKWLELLRELVPNLSQMAVIRDPRAGPGIGQFAVIQALAPVGMELYPVNAIDPAEIQRGITAFAQLPGGGLIVTSGGTAFHRDLIISLAAGNRLPAVYPFRYYVSSGGLISYGPNTIEPMGRAARYVDRILKGEKPADLPVQAPTKYELAINLKTAKALGLDVPDKLLALADEVIE